MAEEDKYTTVDTPIRGRTAYRSKVWTVLRWDVVPPGKEHINRRVEKRLGEIVADLGGKDRLTGSQKLLLEISKMYLMMTALLYDELGRIELVTNGHPQAIIDKLLKLGDAMRRNAVALGLEKREDDTSDPLAEITRGLAASKRDSAPAAVAEQADSHAESEDASLSTLASIPQPESGADSTT